MKASARTVAFDILTRISKDGAYANVALQNALSKSTLESRDKALCTEIVYGTVRRQLTIDALIQPFLKRKLRELDADVRTVLRMTVYQLLFLERIPAYAAIDDAVELVKRHVRPAAGFVNGVLRNFQREEAGAEERIEFVIRMRKLGLYEAASVRFGYPTWMVKRLYSAYGQKRADEMLTAGNAPAPITVRVNRLQSTMDDALEYLLQQEGVQSVARGGLSPYALRVHGPMDIESSTSYHHGRITPQDEGAMLISPLLHPESGMSILDMCAAPGGKATHIAELQNDDGHVDAYDVYLQKVKTINQAANRLHLNSVRARLGDARSILQDATYDAVLLDAPCSGLGVMRRRPDIRHRRTEADIHELMNLQRELLRVACGCVRSGGVVVYSTCTLLPEENESVVEDIAHELRGTVRVDDITEDIPVHVMEERNGGYLLPPDAAVNDGFFMAKLRKQ